MGTLSRWLSRFCYNHPRFSIPGLMMYIAIGNMVVFLLDMVSGGHFSPLISFIPAYIFQGQIWRLVTFIFVPVSSSVIWTPLLAYAYYSLGGQLERIWGSSRFTVYYLFGVVMTVLMGLVLGLTGYSFFSVVTMYYVNMSLFLAFSSLFPDAQFFVLFFPIRGRWLAWFYGVFIAFDVFAYLRQGAFLLALVPLVSLLNYFLFFWDDLTGSARQTRQRIHHQNSRQTIQFHAAQRQAQERKGYLHKCAVCGITDTDRPDMEFRYCSRCSGYHCYCMDHINSHVHVQ